MKNIETLKDIAKDLFFAGRSTAEIARVVGRKTATIQKWVQLEGWRVERRIKMQENQSGLAEKFEKKIISTAEKYFDIAAVIAIICLKKLKRKAQDNDPEIEKIAKDAQRGAAILRSVMPEAPEELAKEIAKNLEEVKRHAKN